MKKPWLSIHYGAEPFEKKSKTRRKGASSQRSVRSSSWLARQQQIAYFARSCCSTNTIFLPPHPGVGFLDQMNIDINLMVRYLFGYPRRKVSLFDHAPPFIFINASNKSCIGERRQEIFRICFNFGTLNQLRQHIKHQHTHKHTHKILTPLLCLCFC